MQRLIVVFLAAWILHCVIFMIIFSLTVPLLLPIVFLQAHAISKKCLFENTFRQTEMSHHYVVHLRPAVTLHNMLPHAIRVQGPAPEPEFELKGGEGRCMYGVFPGQSTVQIQVRWSLWPVGDPWEIDSAFFGSGA